jgi:hypothetical protein
MGGRSRSEVRAAVEQLATDGFLLPEDSDVLR